MKIDHIGIVVRSIESGISHWEKMFDYQLASEIVVNARQMVRVAFLRKEGSVTIKLVEPIGEESPVYRFARKGGGLHHLCFYCADVKNEVSILEQKGARCIARPQPGEAFNNKEIAFLLVGQNLNVELIDTREKKGWTTT